MKVVLNTLYIQTHGAYLHLDHETLKIKTEERNHQFPLHHLGGIVLFGNVSISPFLIHRCAADGRDVIWLSEYGTFQARLSGKTTGNVLLRRAQFCLSQNDQGTLDTAKYMLAGKLQNTRHVLQRAGREAKGDSDQIPLNECAELYRQSIHNCQNANDLDQLRGIEGYAAKSYFAVFSHMIRSNRDVFSFTERSKRPPKDPINALLSFAYTLLANECIAACEGVGLDPQVGFLHTIRSGRPALALDLMEEFRVILGDRFVLTVINRNQIKPDDFIDRPGGAVYLTENGRKTFLTAYQKRKQEEVPHLLLKEKIPLGLVPHVQARLLARYIRGDTPAYQPFILR
ncbi:CRISPR-associated protein Cas1 [Gloeomargarita lithophora Alchichica-D10]|uniref:CRISPR-associated endonuclease Cas1 n=1 Tax=Gloeomargarita lithophora Alchichica-D10 TaxID=1188229 RepID=A0A1J0ACL6_9CYAN|nr:type I-C CRISPR-associated endonuclease Cas1c [Gloeomargarita lithophora]APB33677.1 CRISPR-associated protein Cas1 [Gloeomargarita lithophora Alchichica-D10]